MLKSWRKSGARRGNLRRAFPSPDGRLPGEPSAAILRSLTAQPGPSGFERRVAGKVMEMAASSLEQWQDALGNVYLRLGPPAQAGGKRQRLLISAHMDEVGWLVSAIEEAGHLRLRPLGRPDTRCLPGQRVQVLGRETVSGVVGVPAVHLQQPEERNQRLPLDQLFVDTGLSPGHVRRLIRPGDSVVWERQFQELRNGRVSARALDNRVGVTVMLQVLRLLSREQPSLEVVGVATVQEELGARGAAVAATALEPAAALVLDVCHGQAPGLSDDETFPLDRGPVLTVGPHVHPHLFQQLEDQARSQGMAYQVEADPSPAGTDAFRVQVAARGIPTALLSVPVRYMHTPVEVVATGDLDQAVRLGAGWIASLCPRRLEGLACY